jgi:hypothetical protein
LVFKKNANFFAENWQKWQKIVIITSTPGFDDHIKIVLTHQLHQLLLVAAIVPQNLGHSGAEIEIGRACRASFLRIAKQVRVVDLMGHLASILFVHPFNVGPRAGAVASVHITETG